MKDKSLGRLCLEILHIFDFPVSVVQCLPILPYILLAGADTGASGTPRAAPSTRGASPITTEGSVNDRKVILEELPWVAGGCRIVRNRFMPGVREWGTFLDIRRDLVTREEVDGDARVIPLHGVDPSTSVVERDAVAVTRGVVLHTASTISRLV